MAPWPLPRKRAAHPAGNDVSSSKRAKEGKEKALPLPLPLPLPP